MSSKAISYNAKFISISLRSIKELHPEIKELFNNLDLPPATFPPKDFISKAVVMDILQLYPIQVSATNNGNGFICIGGVRQLQLVKYLLSQDTEIPVIHHQGRINHLQMQRKLLVEICMMPPILGVSNMNNKELVKKIWQKSKSLPKEIIDELYLSNVQALASVLGVSERTFFRNETRSASKK